MIKHNFNDNNLGTKGVQILLDLQLYLVTSRYSYRLCAVNR
jgi:hypothetical protein